MHLLWLLVSEDLPIMQFIWSVEERKDLEYMYTFKKSYITSNQMAPLEKVLQLLIFLY